MDTEISTLRASQPNLKAELKSLQSKLNTIKSAPTTSELREQVEQMMRGKAMKEEKLMSFKQGTIKPVSKEEKEIVDKDHKYWAGKKRIRMRLFKEVEGVLLDGGFKKDEIWEQAGIEGDE